MSPQSPNEAHAEIVERLDRIEKALIGDPMDTDGAPGVVGLVKDHSERLKAIEDKHKTVIGWALAGIGTVAAGAGATVGGLLVEWLRNRPPTGGH